LSTTGSNRQIVEFRENPSRALFIKREIDYSLFKELLPEIIALRGQGRGPICLYLDSGGGDVFFANLITNLIRCPNQDGEKCKLITVASGFVASAAADMLALGDYAIAYPFSQIYYHGTRQQDNEITLEKIPFLAESLRATNEQFAFRLAGRMFRRMVFHVLALTESVPKKSAALLFEQSKIDKFISILKEKLSDQPELLKNTEAKQRKFRELIASLRAGSGIDANDQPGLFKHLLDLEFQRNPAGPLTALLPLIEDDYAQVRDFFFGKYQRDLASIISQTGRNLMMPQEVEALKEEEKKGPQEARKFVTKTVSPRLEPLWVFVVSLCRSLQEGEYPLSPVEAFWAGLVDEVLGEKLHCLRAVSEAAVALSSTGGTAES
jgi:ATP-dependent protease ClpP protease subunit